MELQDNKLSGVLPPEVGNMTTLSRLNLRNNLLAGTIPFELGKLASLQDLCLSYNHFEGAVPDLNLPSLQTFRAKGCRFSTFGLLGAAVEEIDVGENMLRALPQAWKHLPSVHTLRLENNSIRSWEPHGCLMAALGTAAPLCGATATIPRLSWPSLEILDISDNTLSMSAEEFLCSLGYLPKLRMLSAAGCGLEGAIDPWPNREFLVPARSLVDCGVAKADQQKAFPDLFFLDLSRNSITAITTAVLRHMSKRRGKHRIHRTS